MSGSESEESLGFAYVVWVGGVEINDYFLNFENAVRLADLYRSMGYENVVIDAYKYKEKQA